MAFPVTFPVRFPIQAQPKIFSGDGPQRRVPISRMSTRYELSAGIATNPVRLLSTFNPTDPDDPSCDVPNENPIPVPDSRWTQTCTFCKAEAADRDRELDPGVGTGHSRSVLAKIGNAFKRCNPGASDPPAGSGAGAAD